MIRKLFHYVMVMILALAGVAGASPRKPTYAPVSVKLRAVQVARHTWYVPGLRGAATEHEGFISNAGFVVTSKGVVVFDALGTPSLAHEMLKQIRKITDKPIVKVVVSHYHADHIYGLQVFKAEGAQIIAPAGAREYIGSQQARDRLEERRLSLDPWVNDDTRVVRPDRFVTGDYSFRVGDVDFQVSLLGKAHSDGDMTLYVKTDRVLFSGDIIFEGRIPYVGDADTRNWLRVLKQMELDRVVALIPGHGPLARNPVRAIRATRHYLQFLRDKMKAAVDELMPFDEAYRSVDWSQFRKLPAFEAANRRNAYQVYLSIEAEQLEAQK